MTTHGISEVQRTLQVHRTSMTPPFQTVSKKWWGEDRKRSFSVIAGLLVILTVSACTVPIQDSSPKREGDRSAMELAVECSALSTGADPAALAEGLQIQDAPAITETAAGAPAEFPTGTPTDPATTEQVKAAARNLIACINGGHSAQAATLATPKLLLAEFGIADPADAPATLSGIPPFAVRSLGDVQSHDNGQLSIEILYQREEGQHMLVHERWFFIEQRGDLLLDAIQPLPVELAESGSEIDVRMLDHAFELSQDSFAAGEPLIFRVVNTGEYPHEFAVFRLPAGVTAEDIAQGRFPEGASFIGATFTLPGQEATDLVLVNLEPGTYAVVCFIDTPGGIPHVAHGMLTEFTVR